MVAVLFLVWWSVSGFLEVVWFTAHCWHNPRWAMAWWSANMACKQKTRQVLAVKKCADVQSILLDLLGEKVESEHHDVEQFVLLVTYVFSLLLILYGPTHVDSLRIHGTSDFLSCKIWFRMWKLLLGFHGFWGQIFSMMVWESCGVVVGLQWVYHRENAGLTFSQIWGHHLKKPWIEEHPTIEQWETI